MRLKRGGWVWFAEDPSVLEPWAERIREHQASPVKRNGVRAIFRVADSNGCEYFVKTEEKRGAWALIRSRFFSKAESECASGRLLERCGIPCAKYCGWGYDGSGGSVVMSRALTGYVSAMEYWYSTARFDVERKEKWFDLFFDLTLKFQRNRLVHPDFHSANVMLNPETFDYSLIDAYGIRRNPYAGDTALRSNLAWLLPLRMDVPVEELAERLDRTGLLKGASLPALQALIRRNELFLEHDWKRRREKQILSGNSKFSHTEGNREIRHTLWYEPADLPSESGLEVQEMPLKEAQVLWLESFRNQLFCRKLKKTPLIFEKKGDHARVFSSVCKKNSYFS